MFPSLHIRQLALLLGDLATLILFVYIGQRDHEMVNQTQPLLGILKTVAEFAIPWLMVGTVLNAYVLKPRTTVRGHLIDILLAWLIAAPLGVLLRAYVLQRAVIPTSFLTATLVFGSIFILCWRFIAVTSMNLDYAPTSHHWNRFVAILIAALSAFLLLTNTSDTAPLPVTSHDLQPENVFDGTHGYTVEDVQQGQRLFGATCAACHGNQAQGIPGLGKGLVESEFAAELSDEDLINFIITGRPVWDASNTTGVDMPPRGGNPALTNEQISNIVAYLRTLTGRSG